MTIGFWSKGCSPSPSKGRTGPGHCLPRHPKGGAFRAVGRLGRKRPVREEHGEARGDPRGKGSGSPTPQWAGQNQEAIGIKPGPASNYVISGKLLTLSGPQIRKKGTPTYLRHRGQMLNIQGCTKRQQRGPRKPGPPPPSRASAGPTCPAAQGAPPAPSLPCRWRCRQAPSRSQPASQTVMRQTLPASCVCGDPCLQPRRLLLEAEPGPGPGSLPRQGSHLKEKVRFPSL